MISRNEFDQQLFSSEFFERLGVLRLLFKRKIYGQVQGHSPTNRPGADMEFMGYRPYTPQEDTRYLDWHCYARTEELFIKQFHREENRVIYILLDGSASMGIGKPDKFSTARQIGAGLAYMGLHWGHRIKLGILQENQVHSSCFFCHPQEIFSIFHFLSAFSPAGRLQWDTALARFMQQPAKASLFICSDLLAAAGAQTILAQTAVKNYEPALIHLMAEEEINPMQQGQSTLYDVETHQTRNININREMLEQYQLALANFKEKWRSFCGRHHMRYFFSDTGVAIEKIIMQGLHTKGWLR